MALGRLLWEDGATGGRKRWTKQTLLTVKALDPFSPFISLPANIKHATEEIRHWVRLRHYNSVTEVSQ